MFLGQKERKVVILLCFILTFALLTRFLNLTSLPIFTDEAIYIRWTQIANRDPAWRFISLTDGKQPLFIWLNMVSQRIFADPLFAGRLVSVIAGFLTTLGMFFLGKQVFGKRVGLLASFIWAILPFSVWHDRLSLMDSLLACFAVWSLWLQVLLAKTKRLDVALSLGMAMGGGLLTKSSAQFFLYLMPFSLLLTKFLPKKLLFWQWAGLALLSVLLAQIINAVQRLSPFYYIVGLKNVTFIYSFEEILSFTFWQQWQRFWGNLQGLLSWLIVYTTFPLLFLAIFPFGKFREKLREKLFLFSWFLAPFLTLAFFGKVLYPRFMLFMVVPLVVLMAEGISYLSRIKNYFLLFTSRLPAGMVYFLLFLYPFYFDFQIVFNPVEAPLPGVDRGQYLDDWPAGWGIKEVAAFLEEESKRGEVALGTEGTFGLTPAGLEIYLHGNKNIEIKGFWPISDGISWLVQKARQKPTYLLFKDTQQPAPEWPLKLVAKYKRGKGENYLSLYRVVVQ